MLSRRRFLSAAAVSTLAGCGGVRTRHRPNILFLMPDQFRGMDLGVRGNPDVLTPNMDRLAAEGALLENTIANCAVCCPARGTLLTGRYAHAHGVDVNDAPLPSSEVTIAEVLKEDGYRTGFVGKWHLEGGERMPGFVPPGPRRQGFDFWAANICSHRYWDMQYFRDDPEPIPMPGYSASTFTDEAAGFIAQDSPKPFCLFVEWGPPHNPYVAPPEYMNLYDPDGLTMRPNWQAGARLSSQADVAGYYAAISFIDDEVGRLLEALDATGQAEDTIVVLTSDHGDMLGSQGVSLKRKPWEESIQVPGIVRYPAAVQAGQTHAFPFSHVDMAPTLLGLAQTRWPDGMPQRMQGRDLSAALLGEPFEPPRSAYLQSYTATERDEFPAWRGVRTERYTYARHQERPWLLYDNQSDPYQQENLAGQDAHRELEAELEAMTAQWFEETGDSWAERRDRRYR